MSITSFYIYLENTTLSRSTFACKTAWPSPWMNIQRLLYTTGPGAPSLIGLKKRYGELFDETINKPTVMIVEGETEVAGKI